MSIVKSCCKVCKPCPHCYDLSEEKFREYLYKIDELICEYNKDFLCVSESGYGKKCLSDEDYEKLFILRGPIEKYYKSLKGKYFSGLCPEEINKILEQVSKYLRMKNRPHESFSYVSVDDSMFDEWVVKNPYCVAYEDWERCVANIVPKVGIKVSQIQQACNFVVDFSSEIIPNSCEILYNLSIISQACSKNVYDIDIKNLASCKIKYETLVSEKSCKLSFEKYSSLLRCNISHQVISNLIDCGVEIDIDVENNCPIVTLNGNSYKLSDISVNVFDESVDSCSLSNLFNVSLESIDQAYLENLIQSYDNLDL